MAGGDRQAEILAVLAFAAGVAVGTNWPKIKKSIGPLLAGVSGKAADAYTGVSKVFSEHKESVEDAIASTKVRKVKKRVRKARKVHS